MGSASSKSLHIPHPHRGKIKLLSTWKVESDEHEHWSFPKEILIRIFSHLSIKDLRSLAAVCRSFRTLLSEEWVWRGRPDCKTKRCFFRRKYRVSMIKKIAQSIETQEEERRELRAPSPSHSLKVSYDFSQLDLQDENDCAFLSHSMWDQLLQLQYLIVKVDDCSMVEKIKKFVEENGKFFKQPDQIKKKYESTHHDLVGYHCHYISVDPPNTIHSSSSLYSNPHSKKYKREVMMVKEIKPDYFVSNPISFGHSQEHLMGSFTAPENTHVREVCSFFRDLSHSLMSVLSIGFSQFPFTSVLGDTTIQKASSILQLVKWTPVDHKIHIPLFTSQEDIHLSPKDTALPTMLSLPTGNIEGSMFTFYSKMDHLYLNQFSVSVLMRDSDLLVVPGMCLSAILRASASRLKPSKFRSSFSETIAGQTPPSFTIQPERKSFCLSYVLRPNLSSPIVPSSTNMTLHTHSSPSFLNAPESDQNQRRGSALTFGQYLYERKFPTEVMNGKHHH